MRIPQIVSALVLAVALHSAGCALTEAPPDRSAQVTSDLGGGVPTGVRCSNKEWAVDFLDDATHTTVVGTMTCACFAPQLLAGVESGYSVLVYENDCDFN